MRIHSKEERIIYFNEREVWWASVGINIGNEVDGKNGYFERPVLVLKKINPSTLLVVPLTSQEKTSCYYFQLEREDGKKTLILSQIRLISSKRLIRKMKSVSASVREFAAIKEKIVEIIQIKTKPTILAE